MRFVSSKHFVTLLLAGFAAVCLVQAQEPFNFPTAKDLERAFNDTYKRRTEIMRGEVVPTGKGDDKVAEAAAQYYVFRLAHAGISYDPAKLQREFEGFADDVARAKNDGAKKFANQLAPHFVSSMKQLLDRDIRAESRLIIVGSMMLPAIARLRQEKSNDYLIELVQNPKTHDAVRVNALKALRESMPITPVDDDADFDSKSLVARLDFDAKNVAALSNYIEQSRNLKGVPPEHFAVIRFVRREAITSLAQAGTPAVASLTKKVIVKAAKREFQMEGLVAPTLLRILTDKLDPPPSLQEKLEAAHGVCSFKYPKMPDYNPDVAIYLVGRTLEDLVKDYNQDLTSITGDPKKLPIIGYKTEAKRFQTALANLAESAKNTPAKANADRLANAFKDIFKTMSAYAPTDATKLNDAVKTINSMRPKDGQIFKNSKISVSLP
ncbi:MAG: hypothetical protein EXS16_08485 [Gemmataceae bacterium]|nr:hypothetical protein [Gemmataceae bacterium]